MSEYERPDRVEREPTMEDLRQLFGASTPHFALQLRNRIRHLIDGLPEGHPVRVEGEREIARLDQIAFSGEAGAASRRAGHEADAVRSRTRAAVGRRQRRWRSRLTDASIGCRCCFGPRRATRRSSTGSSTCSATRGRSRPARPTT